MSESFGTPWAIAHQASLSMRFSRQECCCGLPFPSPEDLPDPDMELPSHVCISCIANGCLQSLSPFLLSETPWTVACMVPLPVGFSRQDYWSRLPFPLPGYLPNPEIEPVSPALAGRFFFFFLPLSHLAIPIYTLK